MFNDIFLVAPKSSSDYFPRLKSVLPDEDSTVKIIFDDSKSINFKYIWVRSDSIIPANISMLFSLVFDTILLQLKTLDLFKKKSDVDFVP